MQAIFYRAIITVAMLVVYTTTAVGQKFEISEPATVRLADLFTRADVVAIVRILSGDSEHYPDVVYRAEVLTAFKGVHTGERIYFGPFVSYGVGSEYVAFLRRSKLALSPLDGLETTGLHYGTIEVSYRIMYDGYGFMPIQYACVFDGNESKEPCDYGVKVNTYQVTLPPAVKTYPPEPDEGAAGDAKKWIRKVVLESLLKGLQKAK